MTARLWSGVVAAALKAGWGVEDIAIREGRDVELVRREVARLRARGVLRDLFGALALAGLLALPGGARAQGAVCAGLADTAVMLAQGGWHAHSGGQAGASDVTIWIHPDGRWLAMVTTRLQACVVARGMDWKLRGVPA